MTERRAWTPEQDRALKELRQVLKVKKWSEISRKLEFEYQIFQRNGKQCRERYTNHLNSSINSQELSLDEEQKLYKLHDLIGNKWSHISKQFNGRTQNHIKNHFHSKMRKAIRKLNKQIKFYFKKAIKPYKLSIVYRIIEASDFRFSKSSLFDEKDLKFFNDLKNILLVYAGGVMQEKTSMPEVQGREKVLFLLEIIGNLENKIRINKVNLTCKKSDAKKREVNITCSSKKNNITSESQFSQEIETQKYVGESLFENSISSEISLQFVEPTNQINQGFKEMQEQLTKLDIPKDQDRRVKDTELENKQRSFVSNQKNQALQEVPFTKKQQHILISLIEQQEFPSSNLQRKMSIKSFESLKQFQDNYLNDSEIHLMLQKFNSFQNIDSSIFE